MVGGIFSCGLTHTFVVPLDLVKCRMQVRSFSYDALKGLTMMNLFVSLTIRPTLRSTAVSSLA